jgi:hypothetical protein
MLDRTSVIMKTDLLTLATVTLLLCACDKGTTDLGEFDDAGCPEPQPDESGDEPGEAVPIAVDCSMSWSGVTEAFRFEAATLGDETPPIEIGPLLVNARLFDDQFEGRSFNITIYKDDGSVGSTAIYQMDRTRLPVNEFWGDHGFTGLNWVRDPDSGGNLQYACFASDPADPIHSWDD